MNEDLKLFNELIRESAPDAEVDKQVFAFYSESFNVIITKVAEVQVGIKIQSMYKVFISGITNCTRFVNNKENAMIKAHMLINDCYEITEDYVEDYDEAEIEYIARTLVNSPEYED